MNTGRLCLICRNNKLTFCTTIYLVAIRLKHPVVSFGTLRGIFFWKWTGQKGFMGPLLLCFANTHLNEWQLLYLCIRPYPWQVGISVPNCACYDITELKRIFKRFGTFNNSKIEWVGNTGCRLVYQFQKWCEALRDLTYVPFLRSAL